MDISRKNCWILTGIFLFLSIIIYPMSFKKETWPPDLNISEFPRRVGDWEVTEELPVTEELLPSEVREGRVIGFKSFNRKYTNKEGNSVWLYIGYFNYEKGAYSHNPARCYLSQGWTIIEEKLEEIEISGKLKLNRMFAQKGPLQKVVLYWFQIGNEVFTDKFKHRIQILKKALIIGRLDAVIISVTSDTEKGTIEYIVGYEKEFAKEVIPVIPGYLPKI
ncbi:MAG: exosortase C-terminal domain/associated protein EpsI [bacterium]